MIPATELAAALSTAYPALRGHIATRPEDLQAISRGKIRLARDVRMYRRIASQFVPDFSDQDAVRRGLRRFVQRERMRVAARELFGTADMDVTARELADLAQVSIDLAVTEALRWAEARFGPPLTVEGRPCAFTVLGMGKLGGRELNPGSDVDLIPFYETDDGAAGEHSLHEHFTRVTRRFTSTLEDVTEEGFAWRVDLRLRPEGSRGPLVNALAAAERYYETWGRTWERAALVRARPIAGDLTFGAHVLDALAPFVWRKVVDPKIAHEMTHLVQRARAELSTEPERDLKLGPGGIREAEFFVQSLQLIWGGKEPSLRQPNTLVALRRLRARGLVTDRESREVEGAYLTLRRVEHRVQTATGIQTHTLPHGEMLETIARSLGHAVGHDLEKELDKTRRRVAARLASLTREVEPTTVEEDATHLEPLFSAIDGGEEAFILTALTQLGFTGTTADFARQLLGLARRPDFPLGGATRDRHPGLAPALLHALADAADPEQAARLLASFFARLATPGVYAKAMADDLQVLRKLVGLFGASAFLGEKLVYHPELVESVLFAKGAPSPETVRKEIDDEVDRAIERANATDDPNAEDPEEALVGTLRRAKTRITMEVGLAELSGEMRTREATRVLSELADATLERAMVRALADRGLAGGLVVVAMGKLGGREIGYGSDLDIFFVWDGDEEQGERYVRAAQRVLRLVSMPHGAGPGYELDTRLRPSGSHGLLVVSLDAFRRYHETEGQDWERQALVKARPCAGDRSLGAKFSSLATEVAYLRGAPDPEKVHHLRMRMERELAKEGPARFDVKLGHGGIVDVEFAVQWLQMKYGGDPRVRSTDTETALGALEACGYLDSAVAAVLREGYQILRRLEQALRVVHGTSASLIEEGAPGLAALARRMGLRDGPHGTAVGTFLERYRLVTRDIRAAYVTVLGL